MSGCGYSASFASVYNYVQSLWMKLENVESGCAFTGIGPLMSGCGYSASLASVYNYVQSLWMKLEKVESGCALTGIGPLISGCGYSLCKFLSLIALITLESPRKAATASEYFILTNLYW